MLRPLASLLLLLACAPAFAATLVVDVIDDTDLEVPSATVTLSGPLLGAPLVEVTGLAGAVSFEIPAGDGYALHFEQLPHPDSVRVEEWVNAVDYGYPTTSKGPPLKAHIAGMSHPARPDRQIVRVGLQGRVSDGARPPAHLTFLVDVSGSMSSPEKLGLAKEALHHLVRNLGIEDTVAIVTYAGGTRVVLEPTPLTRASTIHRAIDDLTTRGGTAMGDGMQLAYDLARQAYLPGCENRVVVLSDGDANIGPTSFAAILAGIAEHAGRGITMTTVGFGHGGLNDHLMEQLADKGDGAYFFVPDMREARRVFGSHLLSNLQTLARDVKVQVDFDPDAVLSYRLLGYENRDIADEDFRDDAVDAGEVGVGHQVTALYEVELAPRIAPSATVLTMSIRHKEPGPDAPAEEDTFLATYRDVTTADDDLHLAWAIAAMAENVAQRSARTRWDVIADHLAIDADHPQHDDLRTMLEAARRLDR
ncbi:MAG: von Willebrand factor type A domain-containing protein [Alphaproteobacteria bacterium]|nr:von Willebrand factor type A domain-containing protein [Alphaproteobacteria bacterium]